MSKYKIKEYNIIISPRSDLELRRKGCLLRKMLGVILGLTGAIILVEFVPIKIWYTVLFILIVIFIVILCQYLFY
ncbi:hypothetical protein SAMN02745883_00205 [Caminicella sporogenes DSM 14501]|uniref:Uncharacterized protein n=1 Tax=Caminicella sporogenes DSM 14501 TaxID=1121266 RepID=A0A1M6LH47_9FIRM|nr:hypothetical protein [Caminicella sporogenes]WIF94592.1 hypothetical protein QNI18_10030 [Caminicella sporogenes]SHJ70521.1 hypothetical protein SAMN02745883_00205 [Caminicella sporogenes DSM 14501]